MTSQHRTRRPVVPLQLALFAAPEVPERFRLDEATRRRGLRHVAALRARLEARYPSAPGADRAAAQAQTETEAARIALGARANGRAA
jgi:hypothetical protein